MDNPALNTTEWCPRSDICVKEELKALTVLKTHHCPHKLSRRITWHVPNGKTHNQIDFVLTPWRFKSSINRAKTRTYPGADVGSDHDLVLLTMKIRLKKKYQAAQPRIKFDLEHFSRHI